MHYFTSVSAFSASAKPHLFSDGNNISPAVKIPIGYPHGEHTFKTPVTRLFSKSSLIHSWRRSPQVATAYGPPHHPLWPAPTLTDLFLSSTTLVFANLVSAAIFVGRILLSSPSALFRCLRPTSILPLCQDITSSPHRLYAYVAGRILRTRHLGSVLGSIALYCSASIFSASLQPHCPKLFVFSPLAHKTLSSSYLLFCTLTTTWIRRTCPRPRSEPV
jgi:hypothetical protein